jgi:hypothetical protein
MVQKLLDLEALSGTRVASLYSGYSGLPHHTVGTPLWGSRRRAQVGP